MKLMFFLTLLFIRLIEHHPTPINIIQDQTDIIIDCNYTFAEAITGLNIPNSVIVNLTLVDVEYYSFDEKLHRGQLIINKKAAEDIKAIFDFIKSSRFPIAKVIPIIKYNWDDETSMNENNTTAFNYRKVKGSKVLSSHSSGLAIDINPLQNPHIKSGAVSPSKGKYDVNVPGTILRDSKLVKEFENRGWQWGGRWRSSKDYQHFEKKK